MSVKQVAAHIKKKYKVGPSAETIRREVKKGHVGTSPMKMGPIGRTPLVITGICVMLLHHSLQSISSTNDPG